jgi:hypothetical protein
VDAEREDRPEAAPGTMSKLRPPDELPAVVGDLQMP